MIKKSIGLIVPFFLVLLLQNGQMAIAVTLEFSVVDVSVSQQLNWFPLLPHDVITEDLFQVTVSLRSESDFPGGSVLMMVVAPSIPQTVYTATFELKAMQKGDTIPLTTMFETRIGGSHCVKLGFQPMNGKSDIVAFLLGGTPVGSNCVKVFNVWEKTTFLQAINVGLVGVAAIVAVVGVLASLATLRRRSRR